METRLGGLKVEVPNDLNRAWYFQLYGAAPKAQGFHEQMMARVGFGDLGLTMRIKNVRSSSAPPAVGQGPPTGSPSAPVWPRSQTFRRLRSFVDLV
jgi:hypothetical protein